MLQLIFSGCAYERLHCVDLRCDCGECISVDTNNFEKVDSDYVIIKKNTTITCQSCGTKHTPKETYILKEPQFILNNTNADDGLISFEELNACLVWD